MGTRALPKGEDKAKDGFCAQETVMIFAETEPATQQPVAGCEMSDISWKLWIYTNFDCNLSCTYCVAESSPTAARRALGSDTVRQLVDEAVALGFKQLFFTGGEPFLLADIFGMLAHAADRVQTIVLTNGTLLHGQRLGQLAAIANDNLIIQVSLDGTRPEQHDPYRGPGTWAKAVEAVQRLREQKLHVRLATTETPANSGHLEALRAFRHSLGIQEGDHIIRPLARRGFSQEGLEVSQINLMPEVTVNVDGVFWHPLASPSSTDMQVSQKIFPLAEAVACIQEKLDEILRSSKDRPQAVT
jgi:sulfatase maturation enzyme AslB (radical SAM superfamily)